MYILRRKEFINDLFITHLFSMIYKSLSCSYPTHNLVRKSIFDIHNKNLKKLLGLSTAIHTPLFFF